MIFRRRKTSFSKVGKRPQLLKEVETLGASPDSTLSVQNNSSLQIDKIVF